MYRLNENTPLTKELISAYIQDFRMATLPNLIKYKNYYEGKSKVLNRVMSDPSKPNNKVAHGYANYISNTSYYDSNTHYFLGQYLRMIRDLYNIDLMAYYNCWCGNILDNLRLNIQKAQNTSTFKSFDKVYLS